MLSVLCSGGGGNFVLSSSLVGYTTVLGAVAPMVPHGYGFFYRIREGRSDGSLCFCQGLTHHSQSYPLCTLTRRIVISISAWKSCRQTDAASLFNVFSSCLHEMLHLATRSQL